MVCLTLFWIIIIFFHLEVNPSEIFNDSRLSSPIILVPGDGGSRAYHEFEYFHVKHKCLIWVNYMYMLFPTHLTSIFKLMYDPKTHKTHDVGFKNVSFPGWGSTKMIENLDNTKHRTTSYFSNLVNNLIKDKFYVRNKTIRGTPYDFRKAPNENENFVVDLMKLVENTYRLSNNQRVVILGHSLGSLYTLFFLKMMTIEWKKKYVRSFIAVSAPLGGAVKAVQLETSGLSLGSPRNPLYFREMQRSFPSTAFLLPRPDLYGKEAIVVTPKRNYSAFDYKALFKDMEMPYGFMMYEDTKNLINGADTPEGIDEIYCIHGYGLPTVKQMIFKSFPDKQPLFINGDGDNSVNIQSLEVCQKWKDVHYYKMKGADHRQIVGMPAFIEIVKQILYNPLKS